MSIAVPQETSTVGSRVTVVHATPASIAPARAGLAAAFAEADVRMLLDDRLITDAREAGGVTPALSRRMLDLIGYAVGSGADAVLLACSMYGGAVEAARREHDIPVLGSDEALFEAVAAGGFRRALLLGPLPLAVEDSVTRLRAALADAGGRAASTEVVGRAVDGAAEAVATGDVDRLHRLLLAAARPCLRASGDAGEVVDAVVLGNFSIAPARSALADALDVPVLSPTELAATRLRSSLVPVGSPR